MKSKLLGWVSMAVLAAAFAIPTPAMAFRGGGFGGGGFGGFHGGGFGGFHSGGVGGVHGGGFGGFHGGFTGGGFRGGFAAPHFGGGFRGGMVTGRSAFVPGAGRFARAPFVGRRVAVNRFNNFAFRNRFF